MPDQPDLLYGSAVRSFDFSQFAHEDWFTLLQFAMNDAAHGLPDSVGLAQWLRLVHDVAATLPYSDLGDCCKRADKWHGPTAPYRVDRSDTGWLTCHYRCPDHGKIWTCGYAVSYPDSV
jgi:hypothetical protein